MKLTEAYRGGDPSKAWELTQELLTLTRGAVVEAAKARFEANFGSPLCVNCDGLKAGPGIVATCFQRKQCYFTNFSGVPTSPKQQRVINSLLRDREK